MFEDKKSQRSNTLWTEKYRPQTLDTYIGNAHFKEKMAQWIEENDVPHLFLYGGAGTGKTTAAKIIINNLDCDAMFINASDENNVETIRTKVKNFASGIGFKPLKIVVLDECDFITPSGQAALRNLMEVFSANTRFVLTANFKERVIDPIISRTQPFHLIPPSKKEVAEQVVKILKKEKVEFELPNVALIVNAFYPDIRHIINHAQLNTKNGKLHIQEKKIAESDYKTKIVSILSGTLTPKDKFKEIRQTIADARISDFADLYRILYDKVTDFAPNSVSAVILAISEGLYRDALVVDKEINAVATIINILNSMK
jgi:DNA polymerase III delta prime subunit